MKLDTYMLVDDRNAAPQSRCDQSLHHAKVATCHWDGCQAHACRTLSLASGFSSPKAYMLYNTEPKLTCRNLRIAEMEGQVAPRPMSRERLPAMDGFSEGLVPEMSAQSEVMSM